MIIGEGIIFSFSSILKAAFGCLGEKHKNRELRGVGTEKKCCFIFKTALHFEVF